MSREARPKRAPQLTNLLLQAQRRGLDIMEELLQQTRESLQRQREQTRDLVARDRCTRALSALTLVAPALRERYPGLLAEAFERELDDSPASSAFAASGPVSLKFEQLGLMDERQMQSHISAGRGLQQALAELETELAELDGLVSALLGFEQARPERNPLRPEVFLQTLQRLTDEAEGEHEPRAAWVQTMVPLLGKTLQPVYRALLLQLQQQALPHAAPAATAPPAPAIPDDGGLTLQQLHGLVSGSPGVDAPGLAQTVVTQVMGQLTADAHLLAPMRQLLQDLAPKLQPLAQADPHFFNDKQHPARQLLEEIALRSFAFESEQAEGFADFMLTLRQALVGIDARSAAQPATYLAVLDKLRRLWTQEDRLLQARRQSALQALQQAERRNQLAQELAAQVRARPGAAQLPAVVLAFACGPWAQVMAQARQGGEALQTLQPETLLDDLLWSVNPDLSRQQPGRLVKLIPRLVAGLRQGLALIHYPTEQLQQFLDELLVLHQGGLDALAPAAAPAARAQPPLPQEDRPWLAPEEARDSGFMDEPTPDTEPVGLMPRAEPAEFSPTEPMGLPMPAGDFASTEPLGLADMLALRTEAETSPVPEPATEVPAAMARPVPAGGLGLLQPGAWVELATGGQWARLQLNWINDPGTLYLFAGPGGSNHSMTRRMLERLLDEDRLRLLAAGGVVERAFDAVAEQAMRNSGRKDLKDHPDRGN